MSEVLHRQCQTCQRGFQPKRRDSLYCSVYCARWWGHRERDRALESVILARPCLTCCRMFVPKIRRGEYCSQRCRNWLNNQRTANRRRASRLRSTPIRFKVCESPECDAVFVVASLKGNSRQTYCCPEHQYRTNKVRQSRTPAAKRQRRRGRFAKYGLTEADYNRLLEEQGGGCAICGCPPEASAKGTLAVDHDHACCSGQKSCGRCVRGLLCGKCNSSIGLADDDPDRLRRAASYLDRQRQPRLFVA